MQEIGLKYKGNTLPLIIDNPRITETLRFVNNKDVVWVKKKDYQLLIETNPRMFEVVDERSSKKKATTTIESVVKDEPMPETKRVVPEIKIEVVDKPEVVEEKETEKPRNRPGRPKGWSPKNR